MIDFLTFAKVLSEMEWRIATIKKRTGNDMNETIKNMNSSLATIQGLLDLEDCDPEEIKEAIEKQLRILQAQIAIVRKTYDDLLDQQPD